MTRITKYFRLRQAAFSVFALAILGASYSAFSREDGIIGRTRKGPEPGCTCHGSNPTPGVNIQWIGPDTVVAGQSSNFSIVVSGGPLVRAGTNIAVRSGSLAVTDNSLQLISGELTHTGPKAPSGGNVTFTFSYRAPNTPGLDTIFANANSVDFTGGNDNDNWNFASNRRVVVKLASGVVQNSTTALDFALSQNFPNPFNPETSIKFSVTGNERTALKITDITGKVVAELVNEVLPAGIYTAKWNAVGFPSGVYFYSLTSGNKRDIKKLTLLK